MVFNLFGEPIGRLAGIDGMVENLTTSSIPI